MLLFDSRLRLLSLCLVAGIAAAQQQVIREYSHRVWRVQDGLPQNRVQALAQTPDGYLWIGTSSGLARFDGTRFYVFDGSNTPAFSDDGILALEASHDGSLWIGTEGGWLLHYRNGSFETFNSRHGLTNGFVRALHEDSYGTLWIGTDRGFFKLSKGVITRLDDRNGIPVTAITNLNEDSQQRIWAVGGIGLLVVEKDVLRIERREKAVVEGVGGVLEAHDGSNLLLLTQSNIWRHVEGEFRLHRSLGSLIALNMTEDAEGNLWVGTLGKGLIRIDSRGGSVGFQYPDILPDNSILSTLADREGNLWVGTQDGLLRLSRTPVRTFTSLDGITDPNISTVYKDRDDSLWIVTVTGQIYRHVSGKIQAFHLPILEGVRVRQVFRDSKGVLWLGTNDTGLIRVEHNKTTVLSAKEGLRVNATRQIFEDSRGDLWIALASGLGRWDGKRFKNYYIEDGLAYGSVRFVAEDRNGDILVGSERGLNRIHDGRFVAGAFSQLDNMRVWSLHQDDDGTLWIGTKSSGLLRLKNGRVDRITKADGLLSNAIYGIVEDGLGSFWMSTPSGIFSVPRGELTRFADKRAGKIAVVPYGTSDGLESAQMNGGLGSPAARTASGELWFPSVKGLVRIQPAGVRITQPFPALIETMTADDQPIPLVKDARIAPGSGKLKIEYTASSLISPERVSFEYKLEGFDEGWTAASSYRVAYYTNLPPKAYRFRVIARDTAQPLNSSEASFSFVWEPHFYQTRGFLAFCAAFAGLLAWAVFRFYARQTQTRYAVMLAERTRLAREMHDTVIQGCVGVSTLLEAASGFQEADADRALELVDHARVQVRSTLDEARQAVWDLRHDRQDGNIADTLRDLGRQLSAEKGVPIDVEVTGSPREMDERAARNMMLVAREAIRNASIHAIPRRIAMRMFFEDSEVRLEIVDDGCGFTVSTEDSAAKGHYGLLGMRERIEQFGGSFLVRSKPGEGTSVIARLPLRAV